MRTQVNIAIWTNVAVFADSRLPESRAVSYIVEANELGAEGLSVILKDNTHPYVVCYSVHVTDFELKIWTFPLLY